LIADHFHLIRLGNACVDQVRRRVQQQLTGHRGRATDPLYRIRRLLVRAADRLTTRQWKRLEAAWVVADLHDEVYLAWATKEALRDVYRSHDPHDARVALDGFYGWAADSGITECERLARTVRRWETELLAWHASGGLTNARTEASTCWSRRSSVWGMGSATSTQLPHTPATALRRRLAHSTSREDQRPHPTLSRVEIP
jgi:transposase